MFVVETQSSPAVPPPSALPKSDAPKDVMLSLLCQQQLHDAIADFRATVAGTQNEQLLVLQCQKQLKDIQRCAARYSLFESLNADRARVALASEWNELEKAFREAGCRVRLAGSSAVVSPPDDEMDWLKTRDPELRKLLMKLGMFHDSVERYTSFRREITEGLEKRFDVLVADCLEILEQSPVRVGVDCKVLIDREINSFKSELRKLSATRSTLQALYFPERFELEMVNLHSSMPTMLKLSTFSSALEGLIPYSNSELVGFPEGPEADRLILVVDQTATGWFDRRNRLLRLQTELHSIDISGKRPEIVRAVQNAEALLRERASAFDAIRPDNATPVRLLYDLQTLSACIDRDTPLLRDKLPFARLKHMVGEIALRDGARDQPFSMAEAMWSLGDVLNDCLRETFKGEKANDKSLTPIRQSLASLADECRRYCPQQLFAKAKRDLSSAVTRLREAKCNGVTDDILDKLQETITIPDSSSKEKGVKSAELYCALELALRTKTQTPEQKAVIQETLLQLQGVSVDNLFWWTTRVNEQIPAATGECTKLLRSTSLSESNRRLLQQLDDRLTRQLKVPASLPDTQAQSYSDILTSLEAFEAVKPLLPEMRRLKERITELSLKNSYLAKRVSESAMAELMSADGTLPQDLLGRLRAVQAGINGLEQAKRQTLAIHELAAWRASENTPARVLALRKRLIILHEALHPRQVVLQDTYRELRSFSQEILRREESQFFDDKLQAERESMDALFKWRNTLSDSYSEYLLAFELGSFTNRATAALRDRLSTEAYQRKSQLAQTHKDSVGLYAEGLQLIRNISKADTRPKLEAARELFIKHMQHLNGWISIRIGDERYAVYPDPKLPVEHLDTLFTEGADIRYISCDGCKPVLLDPRWKTRNVQVFQIQSSADSNRPQLLAVHDDPKAQEAIEKIPGARRLSTDEFSVNVAKLEIHPGVLGSFLKDLNAEYQANGKVSPWIGSALTIHAMSSMSLMLPKSALGSSLFCLGGTVTGLTISYDGKPDFNWQRHVTTDLIVYAATLGLGKVLQGFIKEAIYLKAASGMEKVVLDPKSKELLFKAANGTVIPIYSGAVGTMLHTQIWKDNLRHDTNSKMKALTQELESSADASRRREIILERKHLQNQLTAIEEISLFKSACLGAAIGGYLSANYHAGRTALRPVPRADTASPLFPNQRTIPPFGNIP